INFYSEVYTDNDVDYVKKQLASNLSANHVFEDKRSVLDVAVNERKYEIVAILLKNRCNPNLIQGRMLTPGEKESDEINLEKSCMYPCLVREDVDMTSLLVQGGFDVNLRDTRQCSSLWHAVDSGNLEIVQAILKSRNVNVNLPDMTKLRPLHVACLHGHYDIVKCLLQRKAIVDAKQIRDLTPLILACKAGCYRTVQSLLAHYANPNHQSSTGISPLYTVLHNHRMQRNPKIIALLLAAGARVNPNLLFVWRFSENLEVFEDMKNLHNVLKHESESPKSLKCSCGKMIRKLLYQNRLFTMRYCDIERQVKSLQLPTSLQDYILLKIV
ncbi:hypothetical protein FSP39_021114, partial [Pinctada imbricata]